MPNNRLLRYVTGFCFLLAVTGLGFLAVFTDASRNSSTRAGVSGSDLAVLVGVGEVGLFVTQNQRAQLDRVLQAYHQGAFHDIYIAAPRSIKSRNRAPFAMAEYLAKGGISGAQIRIDDESDTILKLFAKIARIMEKESYRAPLIFADGLEMPRTKLAGNRSGITNASFVSTRQLRFNDLQSLGSEIAAATSVYVFEPAPSRAVRQAEDLSLDRDLLFTPLNRVNGDTQHLAWQRVRLFEK